MLSAQTEINHFFLFLLFPSTFCVSPLVWMSPVTDSKTDIQRETESTLLKNTLEALSLLPLTPSGKRFVVLISQLSDARTGSARFSLKGRSPCAARTEDACHALTCQQTSRCAAGGTRAHIHAN